MSWRIVRAEDGEVLVGHSLVTTTAPADAAHTVERSRWQVSDDAVPGRDRIEMTVADAAGEVLSSNHTDLVLV